MPVFLIKYWSQIGLALALLVVGVLYASAKGDRDSLLDTVSTVTDARDGKGQPGRLSVKNADKAVRDMAATIARVRQVQHEAAVKDAATVINTERKDAQINTEVSANVLHQLAETRSALDAARALAADRLREIRAARAADSGGGEAPIPYDPEPACRTYGGTDCDGLLAKLAAAEENTVKLVGWQEWFPQMKANHDRARPDAGPTVP